MPSSLTESPVSRHHVLPEHVPFRQAKADLRSVETAWRESVGRAVQRCFSLAGLSNKEAAAALGRDPSQVGKWISGQERPQFDAIFAVEELRGPLVVALSELCSDIDVTTTITLRRRSA
jgi:hypothetical protein